MLAGYSRRPAKHTTGSLEGGRRPTIFSVNNHLGMKEAQLPAVFLAAGLNTSCRTKIPMVRWATVTDICEVLDIRKGCLTKFSGLCPVIRCTNPRRTGIFQSAGFFECPQELSLLPASCFKKDGVSFKTPKLPQWPTLKFKNERMEETRAVSGVATECTFNNELRVEEEEDCHPRDGSTHQTVVPGKIPQPTISVGIRLPEAVSYNPRPSPTTAARKSETGLRLEAKLFMGPDP